MYIFIDGFLLVYFTYSFTMLIYQRLTCLDLWRSGGASPTGDSSRCLSRQLQAFAQVPLNLPVDLQAFPVLPLRAKDESEKLGFWSIGCCRSLAVRIAVYHNISIPICSMYGMFTNINPQNHPNVGKYTIHGSYGI